MLGQLKDYEGIQKSIEARLYQHRLHSYHSVDEVINECLIRYVKAKKQKKTIHNLDAWLRLTAHNCIRELSRTSQRKACLFTDIEAPNEGALKQLQKEEEYKFLDAALKQIPADKEEILRLHYLEGLSWQKVAEHISNTKSETVTATTLRKRAQRALLELREVFLQASVTIWLASLASEPLVHMAVKLAEVG